MRLMSAVLGFVLRKLGLLVALVLSLFLGYLLIQAFDPNSPGSRGRPGSTATGG